MGKRKNDDWDDGRTIAPMNGDELPQYRRIFSGGQRREKDANRVELTKKERRAMTRAMFAALLPRLIIVICSFALVAALLALWLL